MTVMFNHLLAPISGRERVYTCKYVIKYIISHRTNRGSYMSAHVKPRILSLFRNEFNKLNNKRARMLDSIYHMIKSLCYNFVIMYATLLWTS